ncbi:MAG: DUF4838 domain-containing protein [Victivallales bacterium]|nr:DUF4838 domain-containing protein [Victivallales bacterium]
MLKAELRFLLTLFALVTLLCQGGEVTLVEDGQPKAVILLDQKATRSAQMGAFELQHHVRLITDVELPIVTSAPADRLVIKVGGENDDIKEEATRIRFGGNRILLTGGDSGDYGKVDYQRPGTFPPVDYHWKGSLFAVYDFLEEYCDVHFYGILPEDTTFRKRPTLRVTAKDRDFMPGMDAFRDFFDDDYKVHLRKITPREQSLWKLRWRASVTYAKTNHNTYSIYFAHWGKAQDKYLDKAFKYIDHDMFAKGYEGKGTSVGHFIEKRYPGDLDLPPQLCYTNPKTIDYYAHEGLTYYHGRNVLGGWMNKAGTISPERNLMPHFPGKPFYYPYEGNDTGDFCKCAECQRLAKGDSFSQTKFRFLNNLVKRAEELDPKAKIGFSTLAYGKTLEYPEGLELSDRASVELCLVNYAWWHPTIYKRSIENYAKWVAALKGKAPLTLWLYVYGPQHDAKVHYGRYKNFPFFYPWQMAKQMQRFNKDGVKGVFAECKMPVNYLEAYIVSKLAYDPSLDAERLIDKFFSDYYGAASAPVQKLHRIIETAVFSPEFTPKEWTKDPKRAGGPNGITVSPWWPTRLWSRELNYTLGSHERIEELNALVEEAKTLVKTPEEKERLERFIALVWTPALEGRREHDLYLKQKEVPPRSIPLTPMDDAAGGDPQLVDWSKVRSTDKWLSPNAEDIGSTVEFKVAADSKYLYFRFHEDRQPLLTEGLWTENVEFFFTDGGIYPYYHFAHGPKANSKPTGLLIRNNNDSISETDYDFKASTVSIPTGKDWTLFISIPRERLPIANNVLSCDFFRMRHDGKQWHVSCWQPTYTVSGNKGMDSYGKIYITPFVIEDKDFKLIWKGQATDRVKDEGAEDKSAAYQSAKHPWYLSYHFPKGFPTDKYRLVVRTRVEAKEADSVAFGVYNGKKRVLSKTADVKALGMNGMRYVEFELGSSSFLHGMYFYAGGIYVGEQLNRHPDEKIYVDNLRFEAIP